MILAIRLNQWECTETLDDCFLCLRTIESLQQFLQNQARRNDRICSHERFAQGSNFLGFMGAVTAQSQ